MLAKDPSKRIASAGELTEQFQRLLRPHGWRQTGWWQRRGGNPNILAGAKWTRSRTFVWLASLSMLLLLTTAGLVWQAEAMRKPSHTHPPAGPISQQAAPTPLERRQTVLLESPRDLSVDDRLEEVKRRLAALESRDHRKSEATESPPIDFQQATLDHIRSRMEQLEHELVPTTPAQ